MATWEDVRRIAAGLPETVEEPERQWRIRKKLIAWERPLRKSDLEALGDGAPTGEILGIRVCDEQDKQALIAGDPGVFFTTPHFDGYPIVLARLEAAGVELLEELVTDAWRDRAPKRLVAAFDERGAP
jgi:hypothetical protein